MSSIGSLAEDSARLGCSARFSSQSFDSARFPDDADGEWTGEGGSDEESPPEGGGFMAAAPPRVDMEAEEGFALREWRRQNAIRLAEKERKEKEILELIIKEADEFKAEYYDKLKIRCDNNRAVNREKEKMFVEGREKFHAEADKSYWKAISELIPKEIAVIEKKGKKDKEKKPFIVVIQGPKPGKPTDLSRTRQILVKLKHKPPGHMTPPSADPHRGLSAVGK